MLVGRGVFVGEGVLVGEGLGVGAGVFVGTVVLVGEGVAVDSCDKAAALGRTLVSSCACAGVSPGAPVAVGTDS